MVTKFKVVKNLKKNIPKKIFSFVGIFKTTKGKLLSSAVLILLILGGLGYYFRSLFIVAIINGKPITRIELIKTLERQAGKQALENIIVETLISQEASKKGIKVSDDEIASEVKRIEELMQDQGSTLEKALSLQGLTLDSLKNQIRIQKNLEKLLADRIKVEENELSSYFETNKAFFGKDAKFEDSKEQVREQLTKQKLASEYQKWITETRASATIKYILTNF